MILQILERSVGGCVLVQPELLELFYGSFHHPVSLDELRCDECRPHAHRLSLGARIADFFEGMPKYIVVLVALGLHLSPER